MGLWKSFEKLKLHQLLAILQSKRGAFQDTLTRNYTPRLSRKDSFDGLEKVYHSANVKDGEDTAAFDASMSEKKKVALTVTQVLAMIREPLVEAMDAVFTVDVTNCEAKADLVVDGHVLVKNVPISTLLWLEKQFKDVTTFLDAIPVLDPAQDWEYSGEDLYKTKPRVANRTTKKQKVLVKYEATDKHPAQTEIITEDEIVGHYETTTFSGAIKPDVKRELVRKAKAVLEAIKLAREEANSTQVTPSEMGKNLLDFILGPENTDRQAA